jgi:N-methylhydantoinase A
VTERALVLGVDVGGTFTDVVLSRSGELHTAKIPTTPDDPVHGVVDGISAVLADAGRELGDVTRFVHGTTLATNVILQRAGGPVALVTTEGFGDVLRLGRDARVEEDRYDLAYTPPAPPVDARLTFEVRERVGANGVVHVPLTDEAIAQVVDRIVSAEPTGVALCLLHAYARPDHEQAVAAAVRAALPSVPVMVSSEIWPEPREYERAMTTVVCALVAPVVSAYLARLQDALAARGLACPVQLLDSAGDVTSAARAAERPVALVESGGAAGVLAAGLVGRVVGVGDVISFDMGGTTAKAGIVRGGRPAVVHDFQVGGKGSFGGARAGTGVPLKLPVVDLAEVGAGGGSIAEVRSGILRVGPRSAGADPGPACYGRGGTEATVTDADLLLGYLDPVGLAGDVAISPDLARAALDAHVARPLGIDVVEAARAVHDIANVTLAGAIRLVTVTRGIDPRQFALVAFGGAGPMHACRVADEFGIETVVVPSAAGVASANGMVHADAGAERRAPFTTELDEIDIATFATLRARLEREARHELDGNEVDASITLSAFVGMSVRNQVHAFDVALPDGELLDALAALPDAFTARYRAELGVPPTGALQLRSLRVRATRPAPALTTPAPTTPAAPGASAMSDPDPAAARPVHFAELGGFVTTGVFRWPDLAPGARIAGPAVVQASDTTVVVPPEHVVTVDAHRHLIITH